MGAVNIRDVARESGVSVATVSRALNNVPTVSPLLARRVRSVAAELGYRPNNVGRALRLQTTNSWSIVVHELNAFITSLVATLEDAAERHGTSVYLGVAGHDDARLRRYVQTSASHNVAGFIVSAETYSDIFSQVKAPIVFIDHAYPESSHDSVTIDNQRAGRLVADHFIDQGYSALGVIGDGLPGSPVEQRAAGFLAACARRGVSVPQEYRRQGPLTPSFGRSAMLELAGLPEPPDAVFCLNGPLTQGAYLALHAFGAVRPGLAGTDDEVWTALANPAVTVVKQPVEEIAEVAARLLGERIAGYSGLPRTVVLQPTLVFRESSQPPRSLLVE